MLLEFFKFYETYVRYIVPILAKFTYNMFFCWRISGFRAYPYSWFFSYFQVVNHNKTHGEK